MKNINKYKNSMLTQATKVRRASVDVAQRLQRVLQQKISTMPKRLKTLRQALSEHLGAATKKIRKTWAEFRQSNRRPARKKTVERVEKTRVSRTPDGECIYAIGDIHGRYDLLEALLASIEADAAALPDGTDVTIVFLGDYIDRGLQSNQVIELLSSGKLKDYRCVYLLGNHEDALLQFWNDPAIGEKWARFGGNETLQSYGLMPPAAAMGTRPGPESWQRVWKDFRRVFPKRHLEFLSDLKHYYVAGDYLFVHAGLRPQRELEEQTAYDMLWIRDEFLDDAAPFEKFIVHGHTPTDDVFLDNRRLGLDTGAYMTGVLSAARMFGEDISVLSTAG